MNGTSTSQRATPIVTSEVKEPPREGTTVCHTNCLGTRQSDEIPNLEALSREDILQCLKICGGRREVAINVRGEGEWHFDQLALPTLIFGTSIMLTQDHECQDIKCISLACMPLRERIIYELRGMKQRPEQPRQEHLRGKLFLGSLALVDL